MTSLLFTAQERHGVALPEDRLIALDGWLEPTTELNAATHAHAVDPASGDLVVVTITEAAVMERPREVIVGDTLAIYEA